MNINIINLLESIKMQSESDYNKLLNKDEINKIKSWYKRFSTRKEVEFDNIIDLMYFLYTHENIDFYPVDHYQEVIKQLSKEHVLNTSEFLNMLQEFRIIVFS